MPKITPLLLTPAWEVGWLTRLMNYMIVAVEWDAYYLSTTEITEWRETVTTNNLVQTLPFSSHSFFTFITSSRTDSQRPTTVSGRLAPYSTPNTRNNEGRDSELAK